MWRPGDICEGSITNDPEWPRYKDVFHLVRVLKFDRKKNSYLCTSLPFDAGERVFHWLPSELFAPRDAQRIPNGVKNVHVRMRYRQVKGEQLDGLHAAQGVWVKGRLIRSVREGFLVEVCNWAANEDTGRTDQKMAVFVSANDIRPE